MYWCSMGLPVRDAKQKMSVPHPCWEGAGGVWRQNERLYYKTLAQGDSENFEVGESGEPPGSWHIGGHKNSVPLPFGCF